MSFLAPYAAVLCSVNGGTATSGGQVVTNTGYSLAFTAQSTANWTTGLWEIYDYPLSFTNPAGWTYNATSGAWQYAATSGSPNPPAITLQFWGKLSVRLTVNGGFDPTGVYNPSRMIDASCAVTMASPNGLWDMFAGEGSVFGAFRAWVYDYRRNLRTLDTFLSGVTGAPAPQRISAATGTIVASTYWQSVSLDTTSNTVNATMPAAPVDGQVVETSDVKGTWQTHAASVTVGSGISIENPAALGTYVTNGTLALPAVKSASYAWRKWAAEAKWKLL